VLSLSDQVDNALAPVFHLHVEPPL
jgi:hypothetical protein